MKAGRAESLIEGSGKSLISQIYKHKGDLIMLYYDGMSHPAKPLISSVVGMTNYNLCSPAAIGLLGVQLAERVTSQ